MPRILVVENDDRVRECLVDMLKAEYSDITEAQNGETALEILRGEKIDLVITDVDMTGVSGLEIHSFCEQEGILCLLISGIPKNGEGIQHFLSKPIGLDALLKKVGSLLDMAS